MQTLNESVFKFFFNLSHKSIFLDSLLVFFARYLPYFLVLAAIIFIFRLPGMRRRLHAFARAALAGVLARGILTVIIRFFLPMARPAEKLQIQPLFYNLDPSFPSGHAAFFFALATSVFLISRRWGIGFYAAAILMSLARVSSGVHWPLDVLGGAIVGIISGLTVHVLIKKYSEFEPASADLEIKTPA